MPSKFSCRKLRETGQRFESFLAERGLDLETDRERLRTIYNHDFKPRHKARLLISGEGSFPFLLGFHLHPLTSGGNCCPIRYLAHTLDISALSGPFLSPPHSLGPGRSCEPSFQLSLGLSSSHCTFYFLFLISQK